MSSTHKRWLKDLITIVDKNLNSLTNAKDLFVLFFVFKSLFLLVCFFRTQTKKKQNKKQKILRGALLLGVDDSGIVNGVKNINRRNQDEIQKR